MPVFGLTQGLLPIMGYNFGARNKKRIAQAIRIGCVVAAVIMGAGTLLFWIIPDKLISIYNYTDEFVEKHVVEGKIVQKWIDKLWENKYKGKGDDSDSSNNANGTLESPYEINIVENAGLYTATITLDFASANNIYCVLKPAVISSDTFTLTLTVGDGVAYAVTDTVDTNTTIDNLTTLAKTKNYIIKFTKGTNNQASVGLMLTPNA
jgi:hypothetical protein